MLQLVYIYGREKITLVLQTAIEVRRKGLSESYLYAKDTAAVPLRRIISMVIDVQKDPWYADQA